MDCGTFRDNHAAFVDGAVNEIELVAMQRHLSECASCANHDTVIRRALLLVRNMPAIEPSPEFAARLHARLAQVRLERRRPFRAGSEYGGPGVGAFAALAAGIIAMGYVTISALGWSAPASALVMAPVVATAPAADPVTPGPAIDADADTDAMTPLASPAFVASMATGIPVWSSAVLAARAPARMAAAQLKLTSLGR